MNRRTFLALVSSLAARGALGTPGGPPLPADWVVAPEDAALIEGKLALGREQRWAALSAGALAARFGETFLGTPYLAHSLDDTGAERLMVNLRGLDCLTFVETSLALARTLKTRGRTVRQFGRQIETLRYRDGRRGDYPSRLHYFEDWLEDNAARGNVRLLTTSLGGVPYVKSVDYMSTHRDEYPVLAQDDAAFEALRRTEAELNSRPRTYIPRERVAEICTYLATGDVLAFTCNVPGLLIAHTALAYRTETGALHALHAPDVGYTVTVTAEPLAEYILAVRRFTGLMAARPLEPRDTECSARDRGCSSGR